jgi:transposase InsO family protein
LHGNAKLTPAGRKVLVERIASGRPVAHVADEMGISRPTAYRWWHRWLAEGDAGLEDRLCRPRRCPHRTKPSVERKICKLRRKRKLGPDRIAGIVGVPASTVHRVLVRHGLNRLSWMDRPTGTVIRRIHTRRPGELVHMDVKKLGRIPNGGGWQAHGRGQDAYKGHSRVGYTFIHSVVDGCTRVAYSEALDDEKTVTVIAFWLRAMAFFAAHGIAIEAVLTDNGSPYRSRDFGAACAAAGVRHKRTRPYRPQTNGKVERFNRTLLDEWAYVRVYRTNHARNQALGSWLHRYNHHRCHTSLGGATPMSHVTNVPGGHT